MSMQVNIVPDFDKRRAVFCLKLESVAKPHLFARACIDPVEDQLHSTDAIIHAIERAGGQLAEYLDERYGDTFDPSSAAKAAVEAFADLGAQLKC